MSNLPIRASTLNPERLKCPNPHLVYQLSRITCSIRSTRKTSRRAPCFWYCESSTSSERLTCTKRSSLQRSSQAQLEKCVKPFTAHGARRKVLDSQSVRLS